MRVLFPTIGSHGDVLPLIAVGRSLAARGHDCTIATHPLFTREIEAAGLASEPILGRLPVEEILRDPDLFRPVRHLAVGVRILDPLMRAFIEDFRASVKRLRPDAIASHYASVPAIWIAREAGIPCANLVLTPTAWNAPDDPVPTWQLEPGPHGARRAQRFERLLDPPLQWFYRRWADDLFRRYRFRGRRSAELTPAQHRTPAVWEDFRSGDRCLGMWAAAFRSPLPSDPPESSICGFPWHDDASHGLDAELARFLAAGDPPIVFTLGSAAVHHPRGFYALAVHACERLGRRGVLLTGSTTPPPASLPSGVLARPWAPHGALFPRALVNVHHAGIGTTAQCLRAGRPSVAVPHAYDQFNNAFRVHALGVGLAIARHDLTLPRMVAALDHAIHDEMLIECARALAARVQENGADKAADAIERLVEKRAAPTAA